MRVVTLGGCALLAWASPLAATTYHVAPDSSGDVLNIQAAIDAAASGDEIVLSDGTFTGDGNWDLNFGTKELVLRSVNGYDATTIHCGFDGYHDIRHQGVTLEGGQTSATQIEGITFRRSIGNADGGSIRCIGVSPVIRHVRIYDNRWQGRGGGIFVDGGAPQISDCFFGPNYIPFIGSDGEAIFSQHAWLTVARCSFIEVVSTHHGGVVLDGGTVEDCTFEHNRGPESLSNALCATGQVSVLRCSFRHTFGSSVLAGGDILIEDCLFEENGSDWGAGVWAAGNVAIRNSVFRRSIAGFTASAITTWGGSLRLDHCVFDHNDKDAVGIGGTAVVNVARCTFVDNGTTTEWPAGPGSSIAVEGNPSVTIDHTIIAFGWWSASTAVNCRTTPAQLVVTCSDIFGNPGGDWTGCLAGMDGANGNLWADPLFCDVAGGDFGLQGDSPCAPANSGQCELIGALEVACGPTAVEGRSWGSIKALYR